MKKRLILLLTLMTLMFCVCACNKSQNTSATQKRILSIIQKSITEDGICENKIYTTAYGDMNIVHERADDKDTLAIMFY